MNYVIIWLDDDSDLRVEECSTVEEYEIQMGYLERRAAKNVVVTSMGKLGVDDRFSC